MKKIISVTQSLSPLGLIAWVALFSPSARALELDWSGQFRAEVNVVHNYSMDSSDAGSTSDPTRAAAGGYYIPAAGNNNADFQTLFLKLKPKLVVNDNVYIKSEWWLGDPVFGIFGNAVPYTADQTRYYSNQSRGSAITAQRFWGEFVTDVGTFQVGRAPLNWGLGLVWNSGEGIWDRYESTGDTIRLVSKFGAFSFVPSFVSYSAGQTVGGTCIGTACVAGSGGGGMAEYSLALKYDNQEEDFEGGVNFVKRLQGSDPDPTSGYQGVLGPSPAAVGMNYNVWDLFGRKRFGKLTLAAEVPITTGSIGGIEYSTYAFAADVDFKATETWEFGTKFGHAPGQPSVLASPPDKYKIFYFNPDYRIGLIMFNYQLANLSKLNTLNNPTAAVTSLASPYDNPITNANYLTLDAVAHADKWKFHGDFIFASANEKATSGQLFYNTWSHQFVTANGDQSSSLGWEFDLGTTFQYDENFNFGFDTGFYFPGDFYKFSNQTGNANNNAGNSVLAVVLRAGISF